MKQKWVCEVCGEFFNSQEECLTHEMICGMDFIHKCAKCGKQDTVNRDDLMANEGWHSIDLGRMGYGSGLDGCDVNFEVCDSCFCEWVDNFIHKDDIYNTGSNYYYNGEED